jgi:membrane protease YdiL (CAAX protease family)
MTNSERLRAARPGLLALELTLITATFVFDEYIPLSKTPVLFAIAWLSMWWRRVTWRSAGFSLPAGWTRLALIGVAAGVAMWAFEFYGVQALLQWITGELPDLNVFKAVVGNLKYLMILLAANIVLAAFGEEMVWRGYALPRVAALFGDGRNAWIIALILVNTAFGLAHLYQGLPGVIEAAWAGVLLGALYLATGRNLVAPIVAHGVSNNIDFVMIYLGLHPGVPV